MTSSSSPLLLTGATGFLGGRLARQLAARGHRLRLTCREGRRSALDPLLADLGEDAAEVVTADLCDVASLEEAVEGCRAIVHVAARVSRSGSRADFEVANVHGLRFLLQLAGRAGVERFVYTSSFFALAPSAEGDDVGRDETALDDDVPELDEYQRSKRLAAGVAREAREGGTPIVTLYPGTIVGPGPLTEGNFVTGMIRDHLCGRFVGLPQGGRRTWSFVHVDDVAAAHVQALEQDTLPSPAYALGGENTGLAQLFRIVEELTGRRPPRVAVPGWAAYCAGALEELGELLIGRPPQLLTRGAARLLQRDWALDSSLAAAELGYSPRSLMTTLRETLSWLVASGQVPPGSLRDDVTGPGEEEATT
ncbi:MAG: NAD-dependent epimerase/dehydratase family protein [Acidobacteriota bacterium]